MPLLGKRKYINEKIEQLINKLDNLGYDTEEIKDVFYERTHLEEQDDSLDDLSSGSLLPYRNRINETLSLIENLIKSNRNSSDDINTNYSNFNDGNFNDGNFIKDVLTETILSQRSRSPIARKNNEPSNPYDLMN